MVFVYIFAVQECRYDRDGGIPEGLSSSHFPGGKLTFVKLLAVKLTVLAIHLHMALYIMQKILVLYFHKILAMLLCIMHVQQAQCLLATVKL